ncbi:MAG TPA: neutral zinc metallopeptidase [Polyangiales bacterium]|nr:neutral zinc metallopeptidase [Polyangiales bacterium]
MKWTPGYRSDDVEDRRGQGGGGGGFSAGGVGMLFTLFKLFGLPGVLIGGAIMLFGSGLFSSGSRTESRAVPSETAQPGSAGDGSDFVAFVFDDVQKTWKGVFADSSERYAGAKLVLFTDATRTGCGTGQAVMGPFYCPLDQRVYIDLSFYAELKQRFGAPGDFAQAYVIAHEVGHHVQHLLGIDEKVQRAAKGEQTGADALSVRLELQADCLAGIWAKSTDQRQMLEGGDIEEALGAATAIGDDKLQQQGQGRVTPETWTHGSSAQRVRWFKRGFEVGTIEGCDTFSASKL